MIPSGDQRPPLTGACLAVCVSMLTGVAYLVGAGWRALFGGKS